MKSIRRKAATDTGQTGRGMVNLLVLHRVNPSLPGARKLAVCGQGTLAFATDRSGG